MKQKKTFYRQFYRNGNYEFEEDNGTFHTITMPNKKTMTIALVKKVKFWDATDIETGILLPIVSNHYDKMKDIISAIEQSSYLERVQTAMDSKPYKDAAKRFADFINSKNTIV